MEFLFRNGTMAKNSMATPGRLRVPSIAMPKIKSSSRLSGGSNKAPMALVISQFIVVSWPENFV
ncbi:MAG: hypothetical protein A3B82_01535 [Methylophilales bacterium RIFCSPHIGHO2_02_FULL_57_10]|nr:MAG: hypothetical protein A3B82_01535 [Methylophilales bacterium RIFCSPHIGHO2_02_FULL_57_10]